jgi:hypothetical protein
VQKKKEKPWMPDQAVPYTVGVFENGPVETIETFLLLLTLPCCRNEMTREEPVREQTPPTTAVAAATLRRKLGHSIVPSRSIVGGGDDVASSLVVLS